MAIEFATGYVSLIPSLKGAGKSISSQLGGINMAPIGAKMGNALGMKLGAGVKTSMKAQISSAIIAPVTTAIEKQSVATRNLGTAEMELSKSRAKQQSAQAKVATAEEKLATLRESGTATSGELKVAEADLNAAKVALADSNLRVGSSEDAATRAKESATSANGAYIESLKKSSSATGRLETALPVIGARIQEIGGAWKTTGANIAGVGKSMTMKLTAPVVTAATAVGGLVTALGFKRLVGIDTARGQFKGLGYDADAVMDQVDKGVTNTALSMADGASMAVGILATGAVPMKGLEAQIQRTANVSAAYGVEGAHAANLLNMVLTKNKVTYGDLSQMQANGIPIISQLADHYGVAGDAIEKMAKDGKISIDDMNTVLDKNAGAAAEEYAKTWKGVTSNIMSNLGKLGADFLDGVFPQLKTQAEGFLEVLKSDSVRTFAKDVGENLAVAFTKVSDAVKGAIGWWNGLSPSVQKFIGVAAGVVLVAGPILMIIGKIVMTIGGLITAFGAIVTAVGAAIPVLKALNLVMKANVIGIVITAVAALVGALIWFFTQTDIGRTIWGGFVNWLKDLWAGLSTFFSGLWEGIVAFAQVALSWFTDTFGPGLQALWDGIVAGAQALWAMLEPAFTAGVQMFQALFDLIVAIFQGFAVAAMFIWDVLVAGFGGIWKGMQALWDVIGPPLVAAITAIWEAFVGAISGHWNFVMQLWGLLWSGIKAAWDLFGPAFIAAMTVMWEGFKNAFAIIWDTIKNVFQGALDVIKGIFNFFRALFVGDWTGMWTAIKDIMAGVWKIISSIVMGAVNYVWNIIKTVFGAVAAFWGSIWNSIKNVLVGVWTAIKVAVFVAIVSVQKRIQSVITAIRAIWAIVWGAIRSKFSEIWGNIVSAAEGFMSSVRAKFQSVMDFIGGIPSKVLGFFSGIGSTLVESGRSLIGGFLDGIMAGFNKAKDAVAGGLKKIRNLFPFSPAKEGPFSGRGWVAHSGLSLGATFSQTVADSLHDGRKDISDELGGIQDEFDDFSNDGFRVSSSVPDYEVGVAPGGVSGTAGTPAPLINIEHMTVDSDARVKQISQDLWDRSNRANRSRGKVALGGVVV